MRLLIIGQSVADVIDFRGVKALKPGGIFYSIIALNNFKESNDKISLVTAMDDEHYPLFKDEFEKLDERIFDNVERIPKVWLKIEQFSERHEKYENINQNLQFKFNNLDKYDGILINMITGFDINLEQLKSIRNNYNGLIYFDVHTFSRGLDEDFKRRFRTIPAFNEWAANLDFIQVNERELFTLNEKKSEEEIVKEILDYGIKYLIVTLEDKGVKIFYKEKDVVKTICEPSINIEIKNKVGCGDVFGAVFFYSYISGGKEFSENKNIIKALKRANIAAGFTASCENMNEFKNLKKDVFARLN